MKPRFARAARPAATMAQDGSPRCVLDSARRGGRRRSERGGVRGVGERTMGWYTSEQAFACKSATGSTDPLPRMRNASRIGCSERSLAAVAKLYGALRAAREWGVERRSGSWYARIDWDRVRTRSMRTQRTCQRGARPLITAAHDTAPSSRPTARRCGYEPTPSGGGRCAIREAAFGPKVAQNGCQRIESD